MKRLSLFISGFLTCTGNAQTNQEPVELDSIVPELQLGVQEAAPHEQSSPVVKKFAGNIYEDEYWSESVYYDYLNAFWTGYNMQSYNYATTCKDNFNLFMNVFHSWKLTAVRQKSYTELWDLFFNTAGTDANETWYNCFLFYDDFYVSYETKWENFSDFGDIYLSFIFNMLQNSLNIKSQTENMISAYELHNTETFIQALGSVLRSILDFDSYLSLSASLASDENKTPTSEEFMGFTPAHKKNVPTKWERQAKTDAILEKAQRRMDEIEEERRQAQVLAEEQGNIGKVQLLTKVAQKSFVNHKRKQVDPMVGLEPGYQWTTIDYAQAPLALIIGALHALPADTDGPYCSGNTTSLRSYLLEGFQTEGDKKEAALAYYTGGSYLDEVGVKCQVAITSTLDTSHWSNLLANPAVEFGKNLAYNAGYMWVDVVNYVYFTAATVPQNDWAFFVAYLAGDFSIRLFYHDDTPQQVDL